MQSGDTVTDSEQVPGVGASSEPDECEASVAAALRALGTLTYQQQQLIEEHEFPQVFEDLHQKVRVRILWMSGVLLFLILILFAYPVTGRGVRWAIIGSVSIAAAIYDSVTRLRRARIALGAWTGREADTLQSQVEDNHACERSAGEQLAVHLRLIARLSYSQLKSVERGDVVSVARHVARARRARGSLVVGISMTLYALIVGIVALELHRPAELRSNSVDEVIALSLYNSVLVFVGGIWGLRDWRIAAETDRLAEQAEVEGSTDEE